MTKNHKSQLHSQIRDSSGNGNDGSLAGAGFGLDRFGTPGAALELNPNRYASVWISDVNQIESSSVISVSAWIYQNEPQFFSIFSKYNSSDDGGWELFILGDSAWFTPSSFPPDYFLSDPIIPVQRWFHLVLIVNRAENSAKFYVDGAPAGQISKSYQLVPTDARDPINFGYSNNGPDEWANGLLDDVRVYSRALSEGEVRTLYDYERASPDYSLTLPVIVAQPTSQEGLAGSTLDLSVQAIGAAPLAYQWQHKGVALSDGDRISGATTSHLQITDVKAEDAGAYAVVVSNSYGSTNSLAVVVNVLFKPPEITAQPTDQTIPSGSSASLSVTATGALPMTYQWRRNGVNLSDGDRISGATTDRLQITDVKADDVGTYAVKVSNAYGSTISKPVVISIQLEPPEIATQPADQSVLSGSTVTLSVRAIGSLPMTYQWQRNGLAFGDSDKISGSTSATLSFAPFGVEDAGVYSVLVSNAFGSVASLPVVLDVVLAPPQISVQPQSKAAALGSEVSLEVKANGSLPLSYQWQFNGADLMDGPRVSGSRASTLLITNLSLSDLGSYSVLVSNVLGWIRSVPVGLTTPSAVLFTAMQASRLVIGWNEPGKGMVLQRAISLASPEWEEVPGSDRTNRVTLPMTSANEFFRLFRPLPTGLVAWWPGDGDARDIIGTNHGTLMNGATFTEGIVGQAFRFDGVDDQFRAPTLGLPVGASDRTLEAWFLMDEIIDSQMVWVNSVWIGYGSVGDYGRVWCIGVVGDSPRAFWSQWGGSIEGGFVEVGRWHHIASTSQGGFATLYLDGVATASGIVPFDTSPGTDFIMGYLDDDRKQKGAIDEVRVYNRALTADEIKAIYDAGSAGKPKPGL
ncbi:MAG: immunoglobulin domain-containing protein [Verrucomicrobiia bacterium]